MNQSSWDGLPTALKQRVDELVLNDRRFEAIAALFQAPGRPLGLVAAQEVVNDRYRALQETIQFQPEPPRDPATLIETVIALPTRAAAIEAVWDGDTNGWLVRLLAIAKETFAETTLALIRRGGDLRVFNGQVPPWPEAQEALKTGTVVAQHFGIPFYFASPATPDVRTPRWREQEQSGLENQTKAPEKQ